MNLTAAIASLPPQDRDAVLLRDIEERTLDEIALGLGLTRQAVKERRRGRGVCCGNICCAEAGLQVATDCAAAWTRARVPAERVGIRA